MVAVLFARSDSIYKKIQGCDVYDEQRDATTWAGGEQVIAHPSCRAWGQLRKLANPKPGEKELALFALKKVRENGGVLEHPKNSTLWSMLPVTKSGCFDRFGGWTLPIDQNWWGHRARKATVLYIVGCRPLDIPTMPLTLGAASHICGSSGRRNDGSRLHPGDPGWRPEITKAEREHTPPLLAQWLVELALKC